MVHDGAMIQFCNSMMVYERLREFHGLIFDTGMTYHHFFKIDYIFVYMSMLY